MSKDQKSYMKTTKLDGYYASGDYESFCWDKCNSPAEHHTKWSDINRKKRKVGIDKWLCMEDASRCRAYIDDMIPESALKMYNKDEGVKGNWEITVKFTPCDKR